MAGAATSRQHPPASLLGVQVKEGLVPLLAELRKRGTAPSGGPPYVDRQSLHHLKPAR